MPLDAVKVEFPLATAKLEKFSPASIKPTLVTDAGIVKLVMYSLRTPSILVKLAFRNESVTYFFAVSNMLLRVSLVDAWDQLLRIPD